MTFVLLSFIITANLEVPLRITNPNAFLIGLYVVYCNGNKDKVAEFFQMMYYVSMNHLLNNSRIDIPDCQ